MTYTPKDNSFSELVRWIDATYGHTYEDPPKGPEKVDEKLIDLYYSEFYKGE